MDHEKRRGNSIVVTLEEQVTASKGAEELKQSLLKICEEGNDSIILDFSRITTIDSAALGKILMVQKRLRECGGELKIVDVKSDYIRKMFDIINLDKVIKVEDTK